MDSANLIDLVLDDAPAHEISDAIKSVLFSKSADRIEAGRPVVAADMFGDEYYEDEVTQEDEDGQD